MKKYSFSLLLASMLMLQASAQTSFLRPAPKGKSQQLVLNAGVPVGVFGDSHFAGAGLAYQLSCHRFGDSVNARKKIGFTAQGGLDYYIGKRVTTAGYPFRFGNYLYAHIMPGLLYNPTPKTNLVLLAGPSLGIYKESSSLALGVSLSGAYYFNSRMSVGPLVQYRKHADVDALWSAGVRVSYGLR
ncbi:MAG: hypothetical protein EOO01_14820 [Chitinophagaceae bacterium]|nr:MAG: hypothetical protein EOO01_14820 [Chitinophagaceae bacterium]